MTTLALFSNNLLIEKYLSVNHKIFFKSKGSFIKNAVKHQMKMVRHKNKQVQSNIKFFHLFIQIIRNVTWYSAPAYSFLGGLGMTSTRSHPNRQ